MEHFVVSARKYRPQTFKDVVGQQAITNTLANAIKNNHLAQALLFTGPRGVGKTTCARILAKMINQDENHSPDEDFAFNIFELDAASNNSVDDIRNLIDQVRIPPQVGSYKVYIIDEVHMLSAAAFNAFLKTLEEPPKHAIFILATTEKHKIIPTILSRCQIFDFKRITVSDARKYLAYIAEQEGVEAEEDALQIIAQKADGAMRDALSIYDRVVSFSGAKLTRQAVTENLNVLDYDTYMAVTDLILNNNIPQLLLKFNEILASGFDGHHFIAGLASHFRDLLVCKDQKTIDLLEVGDHTKAKYFQQSQKASQPLLMKAIDLANECDFKYKNSQNQRLMVELCLMQLASLTVSAEKKKSEPGIISPENFVQQPAQISKQEKEIVTENEHAQSSPSETTTLPSEKGAEESCASDTEQDYYSAKSPANSEENESIQHSEETEKTPEKAQESIPKPEITRKKVSGLSLKSISKKKEIAEKQRENQPVEKVMSDEFSEEDLVEEWTNYINRLKRKGEKILASILESQSPELKGNDICITFPNETMRIDLEREENKLMRFLKDKLRNTHIQLKITVDESTSKKYAFTAQERYEKLKEKNPLIDKLRATFDLDV